MKPALRHAADLAGGDHSYKQIVIGLIDKGRKTAEKTKQQKDNQNRADCRKEGGQSAVGKGWGCFCFIAGFSGCIHHWTILMFPVM